MRQHHTVLGESVWITPLRCPIAGGFIVEIPCLDAAFVAWYSTTALEQARALIEKATPQAA